MTSCSASSFVRSYVLRKPWPTSPSCSLMRPVRSPATYAVETCTKRSSTPRSWASVAILTISRVPSTLILRASSSGSVKLIEAAQCTTAVTEPTIRSRCIGEMPRPGDSRSAATARTRPRCGRRAGSDERLEQLVDPRLGGAVVRRAHERHDVAVGLLEHAREQLHPDEAGGPGEQQRARIGRAAVVMRPPGTAWRCGRRTRTSSTARPAGVRWTSPAAAPCPARS